MGKTLALSDTLELQVTGIAQRVPAQSHFQFDFLISFSTWEAVRGDLSNVWTSGTYYTYVLLGENQRADDVLPKLPGFIENYLGDQRDSGTVYRIHLQPLTDIHLHSNLRQEMH